MRISHGPTGVVASAQDDRSQHRNRAIALARLRWKLAHTVRRTEAWLGGDALGVDLEASERCDGGVGGRAIMTTGPQPPRARTASQERDTCLDDRE